MTRVVAVVLFLAGITSCHGATDVSHDASADQSATCPSVRPTTQSCDGQEGLTCTYGDEVCDCSGGFLHCRSTSCPAVAVAQAGGSCSVENLGCDYGFELGCSCVGPEDRWLCCYGNVVAPSVLETGALCCGPGFDTYRGGCVNGFAPSCRCSGKHLTCEQVSCGADAGT